jgi:hypothetical protein
MPDENSQEFNDAFLFALYAGGNIAGRLVPQEQASVGEKWDGSEYDRQQ